MVLAWKVGRSRPVGQTAVLAIVTCPGLYLLLLGGALLAAGSTQDFATVLGLTLLFIMALAHGVTTTVWRAQAHQELTRQFELESEGRFFGMAWYLLGFFVPIAWVGYDYTFASNVQYVRRRFGLPEGTRPLLFALLPTAALVGLFVADVWSLILVREGQRATLHQVRGIILGLAAASVLLVLILSAWLQARLQRDLNGIWDAFDERMQQVTTGAAGPTVQAATAAPALPATRPPAARPPAAAPPGWAMPGARPGQAPGARPPPPRPPQGGSGPGTRGREGAPPSGGTKRPPPP